MRSVECGVRSVQCKVLSVECKVWSVKCVDLRFVGQAQYFRSFSSPCDCILFLDVACVRSSNCVLHVTAASRIVRAVSKFSWMSFACAVFLCFAHDDWSSHCKGCLQVLLDVTCVRSHFVFCKCSSSIPL